MRKILCNGFQRIEILRRHESKGTDTFMEFHDPFLTLNFLQKFMLDPLNMITLRSTLAAVISYTDTSQLSDHEILQQLAWKIVRGDVRLVQRGGEVPRVVFEGRSAWAAEVAEMEAIETPVRRSAEEKISWVEIELVDEEGNPVAGEKYRIELPDGSIKEGTLDSQGWMRVGNIDPGTCKISFPNFDANEWEAAS